MRTDRTGPIRAGQTGFLRDVRSVAGRALRQIPREPASVLPAVLIPAFFYTVNLGALENLAHGNSGFSYKAFLVPMAIAFAVTGMSRAPTLVTDIQGGYFDRLCMTPIRRIALLLGLMVADVVVIVTLCLPVLAIGFGVGVRFVTGAPGVLAFIALSALWGLVFTGLPYAVALKTGSPAAVNATFVVFFPLFFLSDAVVPKQALTGWFSTIATYNPVTYVLAALRSLITSGWQRRDPDGGPGRRGRHRDGEHGPGSGRTERQNQTGSVTAGRANGAGTGWAVIAGGILRSSARLTSRRTCVVAGCPGLPQAYERGEKSNAVADSTVQWISSTDHIGMTASHGGCRHVLGCYPSIEISNTSGRREPARLSACFAGTRRS